MNKFTSSLLGAFTGTWIAFFLLGLLIVFTGVAMVASMSKSVTDNAEVYDNSILRIELAGNITDKPYNKTFQEIVNGDNANGENLQTILKAIKLSISDKRIKGIYVNCNGASMGPATAYTIKEAINEFKNKSGKWVYVYGNDLSQGDYYATSTATKIYLNPVGSLDIHGLTTSILFYKDLMDKVGIDMQIIRVGSYKSAVEPYMLSHMSDANRIQTQSFLDNIWKETKEDISRHRGIKPTDIQAYTDSIGAFRGSDYALKCKLVDGLKYEHEALEELCKLVDVEEINDLDFVTPSDVVNASDTHRAKDKIAVLYAEGEINISGDNTSINSDDLVPQILELAKDEEVRGLVLRVNSPGGSAFASEQIWEALEYFKKQNKTFAVSMGDYAASGGYYISTGADRIFAQPTTITGSIGIYGMIPCIKELASDKLGVNVDFVSTSPNSNISSFEPLTSTQRATIQNHVNQGYELFVSRCAQGRGKTVEEIKAIAEGRVWEGISALKHGLIDEFGGVYDAINWVTKEAKLNDYEVVNYPKFRMDFINMLYSTLDDSVKLQFTNKSNSLLNNQIDKVQKLLNKDRIQCRMEEFYIY